MPQPQTDFIQLFSHLENSWMNAWKNKEEKTVRKILADDFTPSSFLTTGQLVTKQQWIAALPVFNYKSFKFDNIEVRVTINIAVLNI